MNIYQQNVQQSRDHVERCRSGILADSDAYTVKNHAQRMTHSIFGESSLTAKASQLPVPPKIGPPYRNEPAPRSAAFDAALSDLLNDINHALDGIADYQRRVSLNATVPKSIIRQSVLAYLARKPNDIQWGGEVLWELGLSDDQTISALRYLEQEGAIEPDGHMAFLGGNWRWRLRLTPHGDDLADGTIDISPTLATLVVQHFHAPVANVGTVHGDVTQNISTFPALPTDVRVKLLETPAGVALLDQLDDERARPDPRKDKVRKIAAGIKNVMETTNTVAEFWNHWIAENFLEEVRAGEWSWPKEQVAIELVAQPHWRNEYTLKDIALYARLLSYTQRGLATFVRLPMPHGALRNADVDGNNAALRAMSALMQHKYGVKLEAAFYGPAQGPDGYLELMTEIQGNRQTGDPWELVTVPPQRVPLEVGSINVSTSWYRLLQYGAMARWPYDQDWLTIILLHDSFRGAMFDHYATNSTRA